jgi:hypothetical protein
VQERRHRDGGEHGHAVADRLLGAEREAVNRYASTPVSTLAIPMTAQRTGSRTGAAHRAPVFAQITALLATAAELATDEACPAGRKGLPDLRRPAEQHGELRIPDGFNPHGWLSWRAPFPAPAAPTARPARRSNPT